MQVRAKAIALGFLVFGGMLPVKVGAADAEPDFMTQLFITACLPNLGNEDGVRSFAASRHMPPITSQAGLDLFVGKGSKTDAWAASDGVSNFAPSIRAGTHTCTVWARVADQHRVEADFDLIIAAVRALPSTSVRKDADNTVQSRAGLVRNVAYNLRSSSPNPARSFEFVMQAAEHDGFGFQAWIEVAPATAQ